MSKVVASNGLGSRRELLAGIVATAALAGSTRARAAGPAYDLVIKGGRVIDPARNIDAIGDVAIAGGRIIAVGPNVQAGSARILDATGKLVVPGLIDIHTHCTGFPRGPALILQDGVTAWIDGGHKGADNVDTGIAVVRTAPQLGAMLINIGRGGMGGGRGDTMDLKVADVAACRAAIAAHRGVVVGVKARLNRQNAGEHDLETLRRAQEASAPFGLPVMIHIGDTFSPMDKILDMLRRGDIVTHALAPPPHSIFDDSGKLLPQVMTARARGVRFDVGHGRSPPHWGWNLADQGMKQGFAPDTTSTDWTQAGHDEGVLAMPTQMTNCLATGLPLDRVIAMGTINAANCFPIFKDRGTLRPGSPADVTVLELRQGTFELADSFTPPVKRISNQKLFANATVVGGKVLWQQGA